MVYKRSTPEEIAKRNYNTKNYGLKKGKALKKELDELFKKRKKKWG